MSQTTFEAGLSVEELAIYDEMDVREALLEQHPFFHILMDNPELRNVVDTLIYRAVFLDVSTQSILFSCTVDDPEEAMPWQEDELGGEKSSEEEESLTADVAAGVLLAERVLMGS